MKTIYNFLPLLLLTFLASCGSAPDETVPTDLPGKKEFLKTKKAELRALTQEVEALEKEIFTADPSLAPKGALVAYETVTTSSFEDFAEVQATVRASESAFASPELPGRIVSMKFEEGDAIRKGDLVAVIDVENITTQRAELEKAAELAKDIYERQQRLWDQKIGSEVQFLQAKNNYERTQKQLATIDVQTAKKNVYAPISGTVDRVMMRQGETAAPGAPILSILNTNKLDVVADASEDLLTKVKRGQKLKVKVPALDLEFMGPVSRIGKTVDPANRTFEVEIDVPGKYLRELKANLLAVVEVLDYSAEDIIVVSQDQIQQEIDGRRYVFLAVDEGEQGDIARKVYVETGASFDNKAVIQSGIKVNDRLITAGSRGLTDGQKISLSQNPIQ
ncbi:efflux RND transporter periplasmic adaptor subunit [Neolewinella aurantiaca]|uniref:Efflux RND transporter periplasmic adaptor subunit n=1 Tax=Neolewinella aurantiaca TaxID=2602767 RepID=A0A5C7FFG7_9BACT|nr:efflux RND transporter periplasmic adaptor subunit [Neolewinella aurantiaca]TXF88325.1 efflux RND transporter periplasmic adaptor subunit [Neolewinella aurantiaca]